MALLRGDPETLPSKGRLAALLKGLYYLTYTKRFACGIIGTTNDNPMWLIAGAWEDRKTPQDKSTPASLSSFPSSCGLSQNQVHNGYRQRGTWRLQPGVQEHKRHTLLPVIQLCEDLRRFIHTVGSHGW